MVYVKAFILIFLDFVSTVFFWDRLSMLINYFANDTGTAQSAIVDAICVLAAGMYMVLFLYANLRKKKAGH